jgi:hypothetical protein
MIGRLGDAHRRLGVLDGLVEPTELREHVGEIRARERRLDGGRPEALVAKIAVERDAEREAWRHLSIHGSGLGVNMPLALRDLGQRHAAVRRRGC